MAGRHQSAPTKGAPVKSAAKKGTAKESRVRRAVPETAEPLNHEQARIQKWLQQVSFKKITFGGVDEADVWKKIAELNALYEAALSAERARYDALLAERTGAAGQSKAEPAEHERAGDEYYR